MLPYPINTGITTAIAAASVDDDDGDHHHRIIIIDDDDCHLQHHHHHPKPSMPPDAFRIDNGAMWQINSLDTRIQREFNLMRPMFVDDIKQEIKQLLQNDVRRG